MWSMKSTGVVCIFTVVAAAYAIQPDVILKECQELEKSSEEDFLAMKNRSIENFSDAAKCVAACFYEKLEFIKDNKFDKESALKKLVDFLPADTKDLEEVKKRCEKAMDMCSTEIGTDNERCELGFKVLSCALKYDRYIFISEPLQ